jgi:hypothetical protein
MNKGNNGGHVFNANYLITRIARLQGQQITQKNLGNKKAIQKLQLEIDRCFDLLKKNYPDRIN